MVIAALAFAAGTALSPPILAGKRRWCDMIRQRTVEVATAKLAGKSELSAHAEAYLIGDADVRDAQHDIIDMAYTANADDGVTPKTLGAITFQACMSEE